MVRIGWLVLAAAIAAAEEPSFAVQELMRQKLLAQIQAVDAKLAGVVGVVAIDLSTGTTISWHADVQFPQASSIKIPIMIEVFAQARAGRLKLEDRVTLEPSDTVGGSGHLQKRLASGPVTLTVAELVTAMIEASDNTATNRLIRMVGMERVNASMDRLGFERTRLRRIMMDTAAASRNEENVSTPIEMARLMETIYRGKAVDEEASKLMLENLKRVIADFRAAIPPAVVVASKPGEVPGVRCETGVVLVPGRPFVLSVMSSFLADGENPVREVAALVYRHFAVLGASNGYGNRVR